MYNDIPMYVCIYIYICRERERDLSEEMLAYERQESLQNLADCDVSVQIQVQESLQNIAEVYFSIELLLVVIVVLLLILSYVCMYICTYVYQYVCIYIYIYVYIERERDILSMCLFT